MIAVVVLSLLGACVGSPLAQSDVIPNSPMILQSTENHLSPSWKTQDIHPHRQTNTDLNLLGIRTSTRRNQNMTKKKKRIKIASQVSLVRTILFLPSFPILDFRAATDFQDFMPMILPTVRCGTTARLMG